jgi:hypothetical protein
MDEIRGRSQHNHLNEIQFLNTTRFIGHIVLTENRIVLTIVELIDLGLIASFDQFSTLLTRAFSQSVVLFLMDVSTGKVLIAQLTFRCIDQRRWINQ